MENYLFNAEWYLKRNPDIADAVEAGLTSAEDHFKMFGSLEGRAPGPLFDPTTYLSRNPDVAAAVHTGQTTAWDHFINYGAQEGRNPAPLFDPSFYLQNNSDVAWAVAQGITSATQHFLMFGMSEQRIHHQLFDPEVYLRSSPGARRALENGEVGSAFEYFLSQSHFEPVALNHFLDLGAYATANPDAEGLSPPELLTHLLTTGLHEGRPLGNGLDLGWFRDDPVFRSA